MTYKMWKWNGNQLPKFGWIEKIQGSPDSTVFVHPRNCTIGKLGNSTKIVIYECQSPPVFLIFPPKKTTKPGNPYYLVRFVNRTKLGTVLSGTVLSRDPLYLVPPDFQTFLRPCEWFPLLTLFRLLRPEIISDF